MQHPYYDHAMITWGCVSKQDACWGHFDYKLTNYLEVSFERGNGFAEGGGLARLDSSCAGAALHLAQLPL